MRILLRGTSIAVALALLPGCGVRKPQTAKAQSVPAVGQAATQVPPASLSEFMQKIRHLSANARPSPANEALPTLESRDPALAAELVRVASAPSAEGHRRLAERYRESGVLDMAYRHFNRAVARNSRDADAYEGLARVWRDWRVPELALGDAHRATFYAPESASARNTYGTVMQALGRYDDAKEAYELAVVLDPQAAYAVNNLCYLSFLDGEVEAAIETCTRALSIDPSLGAARNNLALAFAAAGRLDQARAHFLDAEDRASGLYNSGIAYLASGDDSNALSAFDAASRARPTFNIARERAQQIRARLRLATVSERMNGAPGP